MDEQETITDIIRKIRAEANSIEENARGSLKAGETWDGWPFTESDLESALDLAETKRKEANRLEAALVREKATAEKSSAVDTKFELCKYPEQVLKIGRDFQNKDGFRGAHYDTVKLLCDTIEYQQEQLKTKTEVGNATKC